MSNINNRLLQVKCFILLIRNNTLFKPQNLCSDSVKLCNCLDTHYAPVFVCQRGNYVSQPKFYIIYKETANPIRACASTGSSRCLLATIDRRTRQFSEYGGRVLQHVIGESYVSQSKERIRPGDTGKSESYVISDNTSIYFILTIYLIIHD